MNKNNWKLVERYLSLRSNSITKRTKQAFRDDLRLFCRFLGDKALDDVTHMDIDSFIQYCRDERGNCEETLSRKQNTINKFYSYMILKEYLNMKNPCDKVERIKVRHKVRGHITLDEYKKIIKYLEEQKDYRGLALFSLFFSSGIRVSEMHQLNKSDFDFDNNEFVIVSGKGGQGRVAIFSDEAKEYVLRYLKTRKDDMEALFISRQHNRWAVTSIQRFVKLTAERAGIKKRIHPHLLRHGTAMLLLDHNLPLDQIQKVLGHRNISTTQIYARTNMLKVKQNVNNIYNRVL